MKALLLFIAGLAIGFAFGAASTPTSEATVVTVQGSYKNCLGRVATVDEIIANCPAYDHLY